MHLLADCMATTTPTTTMRRRITQTKVVFKSIKSRRKQVAVILFLNNRLVVVAVEVEGKKCTTNERQTKGEPPTSVWCHQTLNDANRSSRR